MDPRRGPGHVGPHRDQPRPGPSLGVHDPAHPGPVGRQRPGRPAGRMDGHPGRTPGRSTRHRLRRQDHARCPHPRRCPAPGGRVPPRRRRGRRSARGVGQAQRDPRPARPAGEHGHHRFGRHRGRHALSAGDRRAHHQPRRTLRPDREGEPADPARGVQGAALERRARQDHQRPQPRPPGPPHDQGRAGPRLDRIPRRRPDHPTPPNPNDQGTQDDRGRLRHLLTGHDPGSTGHRRHLDPRSLGHREPALGSGRHLRRGPPPAAHRQRTTGHGHPPQHSHQPSPPGRTHQDRHRSTTSWSAHQQAYRPSSQRMKATLPRPWPQTQPACLSNATTGLIDCGNWAESAKWTVPAGAVSGVYFAKLTRTDGTAGASHVFFVVRNDASHSNLLFQTSDTTWQAYNSYGGNSLYVGSPAGRAYKVSYNRPFGTRGTGPEDFVFNSEYPMVRFMEANGYDVSYFSGVDTDQRGGLLLNHKAFLSVGHDEYWSGGQRTNVEAARDAGVNLAFFSGNEVFWKTRWENSIDASGTPYRTLVTYKETMDNAVTDPQDPPTWTGTWVDPRFSPPADGGRPQNRLTGTIFKVNSGTVNLQVPAADGKMRFWRGTTVASQSAGATASLGTGTVGYEWDEDADNGFRPPGLIRLSTTQANGVQVLQDYGSTYGTGNATHSLTLYRAQSGALVFGAGTTQWSWGLDSNHDRGSGAASVPMKQATVNLFADMGAQPATLQSGLVAATASTDTTAPTTAITAPIGGASVQSGSPMSVSGTAADIGGAVGGVEVSTDGGSTWHPATGRGTWNYNWTPGTPGTATIKA